jgi:ABC-type dipeptide/oligopeptide/nickel transport system permease component
MGRYIARRLIYLVAVILVVSAITFGLMHAVPGGPFDREKALPPEIIANLNKRYHLDESLPMQYARYLNDVFVPHFTTEKTGMSTLENDFLIDIKLGPVYLKWMNFGPTFSSRSRTVNDIFRQQLPISMQLGLLALSVALILGTPLGIIAALKQNTIFDYLGMSVASFGVSVPVIVLGPILIWIFGVTLKWLPPTVWGSKPPYVLGFLPSSLGWDFWRTAIMPAVALGLG